MGEIADDLISGLACAWCGIYFEDEHGYEVACNDCFDDSIKELNGSEDILKDKKGKVIMINGVQRAIEKEI